MKGLELFEQYNMDPLGRYIAINLENAMLAAQKGGDLQKIRDKAMGKIYKLLHEFDSGKFDEIRKAKRKKYQRTLVKKAANQYGESVIACVKWDYIPHAGKNGASKRNAKRVQTFRHMAMTARERVRY